MADTYCTSNRRIMDVTTGLNQHNQMEMDVEEAVIFLTEEGGRGNRAVAAGYHDADACLDKRHGEVDDFRTLLVDGEGANGHVRSSVHNLREERRKKKKKKVKAV